MKLPTLLLLLAAALPAGAQEGTLDVLDGETLFEEGWLFTLGAGLETKRGLLDGKDSASDPFDRAVVEETLDLATHYGLRYNVQVGAILPVVRRTLTLDDPSGPDRRSAAGLGDIALIGKWRFHREDAPGTATNFALIGGLELPTGSNDEKDGGVELPPELQPGSGSWDPALGAAVTHEPGRWRFNAALLYQHNSEGDEDYKAGDEFFVELAAGNRFWLEPYPGPFMRFDALLRYRHEWRAGDDGGFIHDSGGDLVTFGATLAFRPRPVLDFQLFLEIPLYPSVEGIQIEEDYSVFFAFGYRI